MIDHIPPFPTLLHGFMFLSLCLLIGCSTGDASYAPKSKAVLATHKRFLNSIADAEIATRVQDACPNFEYKEAEEEAILDRFASDVERLPLRSGIDIADVIKYQENAKRLVRNSASRKYIFERVKFVLNDKGVTADQPELICTLGETEFSKQSQIGRFLTKTNTAG